MYITNASKYQRFKRTYLTILKFRAGFIFARLIFAHLIFAHPQKNVFHAVLIFAHLIGKYNFAHL